MILDPPHAIRDRLELVLAFFQARREVLDDFFWVDVGFSLGIRMLRGVRRSLRACRRRECSRGLVL